MGDVQFVVSPSWPWRRRVLTVLARRGVAGDDLSRIARALDEAADAARLKAMLDREDPAKPAVIAPFDATLRVVDGRVCFELDDGSLSDWQYVIHPSVLRVAVGSRVRAGEPLNDGEVYDALWIDVFGDAGATHLRAKLMALTGLDARLADLVLAPMLDGVEVARDTPTPRWNPHVMTRARFERELGARETPLPVGRRALLSYKTLARMDEWGMVHAGPLVDLAPFTVTKRRLSLGDASRVDRRPERDPYNPAQYKLGAREGLWNARVVLSPDRRRVAELRAWHRDATPWLRRSMEAAPLELSSGRVLLCDLAKPAWGQAAALSSWCASRVSAQGGALAARVDLAGVEGVACAAPEATARYRVFVQCGARDREHAEALCVRFDDDEVL
ncbi:MAG: hypothetical protein R3A52_02280 [Polyangiales bacterium]